ncbi:cyclic nucleotide-binding protein [Adhaeribacter aerolatus]|uniref:Cyclic nucleotide-binding protein n=1 Tax=Adhaeribacter aerolatus TaxID=670289 RepID=A0A512B050_9BACT|nr:Crp/Fnr family transcriptional regulator [Adhaeribacter aerolatus]GEO05157.1 cyclic nucleotide-binding protein [Adhaeribacter aerolatus]
MYEVLAKSIREKVFLNEDEMQLCASFFTLKKLRRKQYLLQEGVLRSYHVDKKDQEHVIQFAFEGWWIADSYSFLTEEPSAYNIDALEDAELLLLTREAQKELLLKVPKMERYFRILLQKSLIAMQRRVLSSLSYSAEEKYTKLLESYPNIAQRISQQQIASYLGVTPETLSRIRKQLASGK